MQTCERLILKAMLRHVSGGLSLAFAVQYLQPPAEVRPIDGLCSGGSTVTISATGLGSVVVNATQVHSLGLCCCIFRLHGACMCL
jgi:hypothetical protein